MKVSSICTCSFLSGRRLTLVIIMLLMLRQRILLQFENIVKQNFVTWSTMCWPSRIHIGVGLPFLWFYTHLHPSPPRRKYSPYSKAPPKKPGFRCSHIHSMLSDIKHMLSNGSLSNIIFTLSMKITTMKGHKLILMHETNVGQ